MMAEIQVGHKEDAQSSSWPFQEEADGTVAREHQQGWLVLSGWDEQEESVGRPKASIAFSHIALKVQMTQFLS